MLDSDWVWAFIVWHGHRGAVVACLTALVVLLAWQALRRARQAAGGFRQILRSHKHRELRLAGISVAESCGVASLVFLIVYLATVPTVADLVDTRHRVHSERLASPSRTWNEIAETAARIQADQDTMARLQAQVDEESRQIASQRAWEKERAQPDAAP